jgi:hypothetical protein
MNHKKSFELRRILPANAVKRTPDCPDDHELAAGADSQLPAESVKRFAAHLAQCDFCTAQVGLLKRLHESVPDQQVSEFVLARASRIGKHNKRSTFPYASRWASAAVIVLAVLVVFKWDLQSPVNPQTSDTTSHGLTSEALDESQIRNRDLTVLMPRVLAPATGAIIDPEKLVFRWTEVPGSLYYNVRVVTDGGDLIWQARVEDTELGLPEHLQLNPDVEYFFRVDAYLASARSISSKHVLFSIGEQH